MNIKLQLPKLMHLRPRITVVGVGGAGSNAVNNMISSGLAGVNFVVANTDAQSLANSAAESRIQLGATLTEGLGAGARPEIGRASAEEAIEEIRAQVAGSHMVFVAAGMGGGTGTGAAAVIARIGRECGALTVGVVTKPFHFEGTKRMRAAEAGIAALKPEVDTLIVIPNQNLFRVANERTTFAEAFLMADQVLKSGIACVVDLIVNEGLINLDFADVRTVMSGMGTAMMGTGEASGERRAVIAAEEAISNPLLDDIALAGAKGLLVSITGSRDLKLYEVDEAAQRVRQEVDGEANIIVGATFDEALGDRIRVSIVASGMERIEPGSAATAYIPTVSHVPAPPPADLQPPPIEPYPEAYAPAPPAPMTPAFQVHSHGHALHEPASHPHVASDYELPAAPGSATAPPAGWPATESQPDFARALSEALEARSDPAGAASPPPSMNHAAPAQGGWASPSGAVFEDAPAHAAQDALASLAHGHHGRMAPAPETTFQPQPPVDPRRQPRRVPAVEEFPLVGQREYHAKSAQYGEPPPPPRAYAQPAADPAPAPEPRRGFFARLFGGKNKPNQEPAPQRSYPEASHVPHAVHEKDLAMVHGQPAAARRHGDHRNPEHHDLPAFFGAERK